VYDKKWIEPISSPGQWMLTRTIRSLVEPSNKTELNIKKMMVEHRLSIFNEFCSTINLNTHDLN